MAVSGSEQQLDRPRRGKRRAKWLTPESNVAAEATGAPRSSGRLIQVAELLATLPPQALRRIADGVTEYLTEPGQAEQLRLLLEDEAAAPDDTRQHPRGLDSSSRSANGRHKLIAFGWYGGKFSHLNWLLPLLPRAHHYCEPFGGSGAVLLNREPSPVETYNDIDGEVVDFFRVLRDETDALLKAIALTPFSREEFAGSLQHDTSLLPDVERARLFFVRARQVRTGLAQTASIGRWANCKNTSRAGMAGVVSRWLGSVEGLPEIAERLLRVQIESRSAQDVIKLYDSPETLFYCDPPYPHESRGDSKAYKYEMSTEEHTQLAHLLSHVRGKAAVSGYRCELLDRLYAEWRCVEAPEKNCHSVKKPRREALWMNY